MGNTESAANVAQRGARVSKGEVHRHALYRLVDVHGGGELLPWMRYAITTGDYSIIDEFVDSKVREYIYNSGKGKMVAVAELVKIRNKERNAALSALKRKKGKGKSGPNILDDFNQEGQNQGDLKKALKLLDGGGKSGKGDSKYREVAWRLDERGSMGENLVGVCLIQGTAVHIQLAIKLMLAFPKLINDIFISEDYYGLSPLHQAIVNEDPHLVHFLLQHGADVNQRCYGAMFGPEDQKSTRTDSLEHEFVDVSQDTNYSGRTYFGEYPLSFAACTNQVDCYRLLISKRANPNQQDTNGNTVLHLAVIHSNVDMLKLAFASGCKLHVMNRQNLTPLTLAARMGKKTMFEQILKLESDVVWMYGDASSHAYPLANIDTINQETGELNEDSALSLVVYGDTGNHLDLLDGLLEEVLQAKWNSFARRRALTSFLCFVFYYGCIFTAFGCRPFSMTTQIITDGYIDGFNTSLVYGAPTVTTVFEQAATYLSTSASVETAVSVERTVAPPNVVKARIDATYFETDLCHLWWYFGYGWQQNVRLITEPLVLVMAIFQIVIEILDIRNIGKQRWWRALKAFPAKIIYKISFIFVVFIIPFRLACGFSPDMLLLDNVLSVLTVVFSGCHFLFYSRAVKFIGPFVLMIYTILSRDLTRFMVIYVIFLVGFSQSFYVIFMACAREEAAHENKSVPEVENILDAPPESLIRIFIMTIGEFMQFYKSLEDCDDHFMRSIGKFMFLVFELFVSILQLNLIIAMMTRTYEEISSSQKEWKRQWAQVILMLELSLQPKDRLLALLKYSRPIGTDKRKRAFVVAKKVTVDSMSDIEKELREKEANDLREARRGLLKRRIKDIMQMAETKLQAIHEKHKRQWRRPLSAITVNGVPFRG